MAEFKYRHEGESPWSQIPCSRCGSVAPLQPIHDRPDEFWCEMCKALHTDEWVCGEHIDALGVLRQLAGIVNSRLAEIDNRLNQIENPVNL